MKQLMFQILYNSQQRTVILQEKGNKQGNPRIVPAYWLEKVYKPHKQEKEPK